MIDGPGDNIGDSGSASARSSAFHGEEILENVSDAFLALDSDWRLTYVNAAAERVLGRGREQLLGCDFWTACPLLAAPEIEREYRHSAAERLATRFEWGRAGRRFKIRVIPSQNNLHLYLQEVPETRGVEQMLRENVVRIRLALDAGRMATWDWNLLTGEVVWSDRHYRMLGLVPDAAANPLEKWMQSVHPDDRSMVEQQIERSRREKDLFQAEYRVVWPDASVHWLEGRGQFFYDADDVPVRMTGVLADVTERKQTEEALRHRQKLEGIGLLAGGIAHDFNNLLAGILGGASFALDQLPASHPAGPMLQIVVQSAERAALLTRQLLAYSGRGKFVIRRIDLAEVVRETSDLVCASLPKSISCIHHVEPDLPEIDADPSQMHQLVMNLLINAGESIGEHHYGVVSTRLTTQYVDAERAAGQFAAYEIPPGRYVVLEVSDTGCGMDAEILSKIFDPFFTTKFTGRGLGLAAAQGIVRGHHGAMTVESVVGQGSTFRILLPVPAARSEILESANAMPNNRAEARGTILVVDDEELVRQVAQTACQRFGFEVLAAGGGEEALRLLRENAGRVSLILLDMNMPAMSGIEALRRLRAEGIQVPVLISSGFSELEVMDRFHGLDIAGVIEKPFTARKLVDRICELLP